MNQMDKPMDARSTTEVQTASARRYMAQLAKHFAHKVDVEAEEDHTVFRFSCGTARLDATADRLIIAVESPDADARGETEDVVERHLVRFAFREALGPLEWTRA